MFSSYMSLKQRLFLMEAFVDVRFGHCSSVWMFCRRVLNGHERLLRTVYKGGTNYFCELFQRDHSFLINHRRLATEFHKMKENLSTKIMNILIRILKNN